MKLYLIGVFPNEPRERWTDTGLSGEKEALIQQAQYICNRATNETKYTFALVNEFNVAETFTLTSDGLSRVEWIALGQPIGKDLTKILRIKKIIP